jgi:hypothetical protein
MHMLQLAKIIYQYGASSTPEVYPKSRMLLSALGVPVDENSSKLLLNVPDH